jgi:hypothetical protein
MDYRNTTLFTGICWNIEQHPDKAERRNEDDVWIPLTVDDVHRVRHTDINTPYLIVPLTRFYEVSEVIPLNRKLTAHNVMQTIYDFYHTPLQEKDLLKIKHFPDEPFEYCKKAIEQAANKKEVCYINLRGDSNGFEGIEKVAANVYKLQLAS